ncbi:ABC transporter substrate-binding protein [Salinicoccus kekensis]|uniref:Amino acid ABC transporter substrate-binding protein (PAAT family) n=1 Tax=Salinicoccus kekensis TaxID=714307 RepID=A0A285UPL9_9STAP|nr:ABC transporter substrate-binding protein [Salinicoccus kekensis]SOC43703.1 amino acid ABC transporter substrate-binding protein (PAAT family) [Salinicoccus kekensis]
MKGKNFILNSILLLFVVILVGCGNGDATGSENDGEDNAGNDNEEKETLVVASTPTGPPYTFMNNETDEMEGIMIDIVDIIGEELDKEIQIESTSFSSLIPSLQGGKVDLISAGMVITEERKEVINFSDEVFGFGEGLIVHEDNNDISTFEDLEGKTVGTQQGTIYYDLIEENGNTENNSVYESIGDMLQDLSNGRLDAVVADEPVLIYLEENNPNFAVRIIEDYESQIIDGVGLGVSKDDEELLEEVNGVIADLKADGSLEEIYSKWNVSWSFE